MKNKFWFGVILTIAILLVVRCFEYADAVRGYNGTGSEVFTIALPLWIVWKKLTTMGQKIERLEQYNQELQKHIQ